MPPNTTNPFVALAYFFAVLVAAGALGLLMRFSFLAAKASTKLDTVVDGQAKLTEEFKNFRNDTRTSSQDVELSLTIIESDLNAVQAKVGLPVRPFPDRRTGPSDRRSP